MKRMLFVAAVAAAAVLAPQLTSVRRRRDRRALRQQRC